jgi:hypothetical protein
LGAPNGNRSIPLNESQGSYAGTKITIVDTPENRTVPAEDYLNTGGTKTEEQTCWINHPGVELGDGIKVNKSVDIPCDGGEIGGPQDLESVGHSDDTVLIKPGDEIEYQNGTYGVLVEIDGEERVVRTFTVGTGGPGSNLYNSSVYSLPGLIGKIIVAAIAAAVLVMAALLAAVGIREVLAE